MGGGWSVCRKVCVKHGNIGLELVLAGEIKRDHIVNVECGAYRDKTVMPLPLISLTFS